MSDALENKAVEILDKSQAAIATFADKLTDLAKQYGPEVADAALQMARIDALSMLVPAIVVLAVSALILRWYAPEARRQMKDNGGLNELMIIGGIIGGVLGGVANVWALVTFLDVWLWIGIFEPKLYLAKRILGL